jgi:hypothetical protein
MNQAAALLHGDPWILLIIPLLLAGLALLIGVAIFFVWWRLTNLPASILGLSYLVAVVVLALPSIFVGSVEAAAPSVSVMAAFILTLPGSALAWWGFGEHLRRHLFEFIIVAFGGVINAVAIFGLGSLARYFTTRTRERDASAPLP